jgi:hypothetical protein
MDMKSISQQLQNDIRAILEAKLHPNQQKIDVHEPEKDEITAHDFKKLRDMKKGKSTNDTSMQKDEAVSPAQQAAMAISLIKAGKKKGTMPKPQNEDMELDEAEQNKPASPFDLKNYKSQLPSKPGEKAGFDSKKTSTGTVYSRKAVKEESEATEYFTFAQFLEEARKLFDDKDAVIIANEAFNNQDITLISKQSQSPEA